MAEQLSILGLWERVPEEAARALPDAPRAIVRAVQSAATTRAARALIAADGPAARLGDGRPAALLPFLAGDAAHAQALLREACEGRVEPRRGRLELLALHEGHHPAALEMCGRELIPFPR